MRLRKQGMYSLRTLYARCAVYKMLRSASRRESGTRPMWTTYPPPAQGRGRPLRGAHVDHIPDLEPTAWTPGEHPKSD